MILSIRDKKNKFRGFSAIPKKVSEDKNFLKPTDFFIRKTSVDLQQEDKKIIQVRPPSRRIRKNTISSSAKRTSKKTAQVFEKLETKTIDQSRLSQEMLSSFSIPKSNWRTFDFSMVA